MRTLTALAAAWCVAPLIGFAAFYIRYRISPNTGGQNDVGNSSLTFVIGLLAAGAGFAATMYVVLHYVPDSALRTVQIVDAIGTVALLTAIVLMRQSTRMYPAPQYDDFRGILDVEVRTPKELLADRNAGGRIVVHLGDGSADERAHNELIREEGHTAVLPVEMEVIKHRRWSVAVLRNTDPEHGYWERYRFELPMPDSPTGPLPWSDWIKPARKDGWDTAEDITVRFRWVLASRQEERVYRP